jgi:hypothetical protein
MHAIGQLSEQGHEPGWPARRVSSGRDHLGTPVTCEGPSLHPWGETLHIDERVVVSPTAGVFTPLTVEGSSVEVGQWIGHVRTGTETVPVCTPFTGRLVAMAAWQGERVDRCQRVAWIRQRDEPRT